MMIPKTVSTHETTEIIIKHQKGLIPVNFKELWAFRELLFFLSWRDIKVKYKQTALGALWAILQTVIRKNDPKLFIALMYSPLNQSN